MAVASRDSSFFEGDLAVRWVEISERVLRIRASLDPTSINVELEKYADEVPADTLAPLFLLWAADNCMHSCCHEDAIRLYDRSLSVLHDGNRTFAGIDLRRAILQGKALALELDKKVVEAITTYRAIADEATNGRIAAEAQYAIADIAQEHGNHDEAINALQSLVNLAEGDSASVELLDRAKRDIRQYQERGRCFLDETELRHRLIDALERKDTEQLTRLASPTHFRIGVAAGHADFADAQEELVHLINDLAQSRVRLANPDRSGGGSKHYLHTRGWHGRWYRGRVSFLLVNTPFGWQWQGIVLLTPTSGWRDRWQPVRIESNQPVSMELKAPWPARMWFMAGGLSPFLALLSTIAVLTGIWVVGTLLAAVFVEAMSLRRCGFGTRGFYYNFRPTHIGDDAFAIDFSRYQRGLPFINTSARASGNAVQMGVVDAIVHRNRTGSDRGSNLVQIHHVSGATREGRFDPATGTAVLGPITFSFEPYWSRYLHFTGPGMIAVSVGQFIRQGAFLGRIDDTGSRSLIDHLHFSLHDDRLPSITGGRPGRSVRPTPMDGETLEDDDDGKCVRSTNEPFP